MNYAPTLPGDTEYRSAGVSARSAFSWTPLPEADHSSVRPPSAAMESVFTPEPTAEHQALTQTLAQTYSLQSLQPGWTGYDSIPPSPAVVKRAIEWLLEFYQECQQEGKSWFRPNVTASAEGEVVYEWWSDSRLLTVDVGDDGIGYMKFGRGSSTLREHGSADDPKKCTELMRWFGE